MRATTESSGPLYPGSARIRSPRRWERLALLALPALALSCGAPAAAPPADPTPIATRAAPTGDAWVEETLARLTLRQKVAQMVVPWVGGEFLSTDSDAFDRLREWVVGQGVGGLIVSIGPPLEVAAKLNALQRLADVPLLISADMENGPGMRLNGVVAFPSGLKMGGGTLFPPVMAVGATGDERLAYEVGRITAREARAVGVHMVYAPVADVNNNPANPVINTRSYGADPKLVARMAAAHVRGLQENGAPAVAKHFPGHGDTGVDSHIGLPVIGVDRPRADSVELIPFRAAIGAGVAGVMSAHIAFPALIGDSTTPGTLSPRILTGLLQEELGFKGLVLTDALDMGGIVRGYGPGNAAVMSVKAGSDVLLMPTSVPVAIDAVVAAVERGELTAERIDRSVRKLLRIKAGLGLEKERTVSLEAVAEKVGVRSHQAVAEEIARRSITLVRDRANLVPLKGASSLRVLSVIYNDDPDPFGGRAFQQALAGRFRQLRTATITPDVTPARLDSLLTTAKGVDLVLVSPLVRATSGKGSVAIPPRVADFITALDKARPTVVTSFGNPYLLEQFPGIGTYMIAWGAQDIAQHAAVRALMGESAIAGKLPISLPPNVPVGTGIVREQVAAKAVATNADALSLVRPEEAGFDPARLARVDQLLQEAVSSGAVPGAVIAVGRKGKLVRLAGYGRLDTRPGFGAATDSSLYDLASLTKVVGTTTAAMILVEEGKLALDAPLSRYLPEFTGEGREKVTIRQLLTHTAGLPAFGPLWQANKGRDAYLKALSQVKLESAPGTREVYSDYGIILLGLAIERITQTSLDRFLETRVFTPLGMRETGYNPRAWKIGAAGALTSRVAGTDPALPGEAAILARTAPTEIDTIFRKTHLHGSVHDENAYAIGGVSGHAGLFSSARDLARFSQMLLGEGALGSTRILRPETVRTFIARQSAGSSRALGWDTPSKGSSAGDYFSARSFGHTGFTGTSIWIDPEQDLFVVLLTNRVNPTRANQKHVPLRRAVHDAVAQAIADATIMERQVGP